MTTPTAKFIATKAFKSSNSNWDDTLQNIWDDVETKFDDQIGSGYNLNGGVITGNTIELDDSDRQEIENGSLSGLNSLALSAISNDTTVDSVVVLDEFVFENSSVGGRAQLGLGGNHENLDIRVAICGDGGIHREAALHELLHTLDARHYNSTSWDPYKSTVMGPTDPGYGCNGGENGWGRAFEICQVGECSDGPYQSTESRAVTFMYNHL